MDRPWFQIVSSQNIKKWLPYSLFNFIWYKEYVNNIISACRYLLKRCLTEVTNSGPWGGVSTISWYNHCLPLEEMFDRSDKLWSMGRCLYHQLVQLLPTSWRDVWQKWQTLVHKAVSLPSAGTTIAYLLKRCLTEVTNSGPWGGVSAISWYNHCLPLEEMFDRSDKLWSMGRCLCHQLVHSLPAVVDPLALIAV